MLSTMSASISEDHVRADKFMPNYQFRCVWTAIFGKYASKPGVDSIITNRYGYRRFLQFLAFLTNRRDKKFQFFLIYVNYLWILVFIVIRLLKYDKTFFFVCFWCIIPNVIFSLSINAAIDTYQLHSGGT